MPWCLLSADSACRLLIPLLLLTATASSAQTQRQWEHMLAETLNADDMDGDDWTDTYDLLCTLEQTPLNLNTASREALEQLPFLTEEQVQAIVEYRDSYGPMRSAGELRMIRQLDYQQIALLRCFTYIGPEQPATAVPSLANVVSNGRHELMADVRVPIYKQEDDTDKYLGYNYRHTLRYQFHYGDSVRWGLVGAQDAGEPFMAGRNKAGYDHYSLYLQLQHLGPVDNLVVGHYKLSAGMGLVLNNSFSLGKLATLRQMGRTTATVRPHASRSASNYFQGAAATLRLSPQWLLTAFVSYRALDATLNADGTASTLLTSGYHRTAQEMDKKHNTRAADAGTRIAFRHGGLHAGATAVYTHLSRSLEPDATVLYRRHYPRGQHFANMSVDYGYMHYRFALNGETAMDRHGAMATANSLSVKASDAWSVLFMQRFFSYRYSALYARSMSEGGRVQNESGLCAALSWQPSPGLRLQAYTDYAYFAWARYQASQSSHAWDNLLTATLTRGPWTMTARYRLHLRQKDDDQAATLVNTTEHRARLSLGWQGAVLTATTQADAVTAGGERGAMLSQTVACGWRWLKLNLHAAYHHTTSYAARLYAYEAAPRYAFSFPAYYGRGYRLAVMTTAQLGRRLMLTAKLGHTRSQTDADLQVRWKF